MLAKHFQEYISHLPQTRLALPFPIPYNVLINGCAFHTYHALRTGSGEVVDEAIRTLEFEKLLSMVSETRSDFVASQGNAIIRRHTILHC